MVTSNITCPLTISRGVNIGALSPTDMTAAMQYRKIVAEIPYIKNKNTLAVNKYKNYRMQKIGLQQLFVLIFLINEHAFRQIMLTFCTSWADLLNNGCISLKKVNALRVYGKFCGINEKYTI